MCYMNFVYIFSLLKQNIIDDDQLRKKSDFELKIKVIKILEWKQESIYIEYKMAAV